MVDFVKDKYNQHLIVGATYELCFFDETLRERKENYKLISLSMDSDPVMSLELLETKQRSNIRGKDAYDLAKRLIKTNKKGFQKLEPGNSSHKPQTEYNSAEKFLRQSEESKKASRRSNDVVCLKKQSQPKCTEDKDTKSSLREKWAGADCIYE